MKRVTIFHAVTAITVFFLATLVACNTQDKKSDPEINTSMNATINEYGETIPDSIIQFLITSAARDFNEHQSPKVSDIRNVKAGYVSEGKERTYLICGEFLPEGKNEWVSFTTIKTSGYEQYIGGNTYCEKAIFAAVDSTRLRKEIKNKLHEPRGKG